MTPLPKNASVFRWRRTSTFWCTGRSRAPGNTGGCWRICSGGRGYLFHVYLDAFVQRVGWIQDNPVASLQPLDHLQRGSVIATDHDRLQMSPVTAVNGHCTQTLGPK